MTWQEVAHRTFKSHCTAEVAGALPDWEGATKEELKSLREGAEADYLWLARRRTEFFDEDRQDWYVKETLLVQPRKVRTDYGW